jgi:hypothetical protein
MTGISDLARGIVVETRTKSWLGDCFYSDKIHYSHLHPMEWESIKIQPYLNELARIPVIGMVAGITRMALAIIHTIGHLLAALVTFDKGHCYHAAKGSCEFLRGFIEALPIAGRLFAKYYYEAGDWWMIKIYNPDDTDTLDRYANLWQYFKQNRPTAYIIA